ncbi:MULTISPECIES: cytochrome o ubiquinol oxidase subunit IV [unclassified Salipiger]|uniref:cytochrome o ubiquinol oxidase subunit IV n=1 Tax=unclassified Salipiger TaxID=2640570 RepID=UPI0013BD8318|nr:MULTISPECIES: cytochrome o ubiquinol oxidase subunit IV [unclassified Salipiger]NDV53815.1 cytochrome o ubiquinol oxidase subunit IV [Salipiger sp. PrR003]NDW35664.1 cytochrome o ubiquinol oxidase subunit IV [Salipiger sp. PrR007]
MSAHSDTSHGTMGQLMIGFALAAILSIIPFALVMMDTGLAPGTIVAIIMGLGAVQIVVHLVYFLHLKSSTEEGWTLAATILAVVIVAIVLAGSLWVMYNMNTNMMPMSEGNMTMDSEATPGASMQGMTHGGAEGSHAGHGEMDHSQMDHGK